MPHTGVKLAPGSYQVQPYSNDGHIYMTCSPTRTAPFEIDLSNTQLTFTVSLRSLLGCRDATFQQEASSADACAVLSLRQERSLWQRHDEMWRICAIG